MGSSIDHRVVLKELRESHALFVVAGIVFTNGQKRRFEVAIDNEFILALLALFAHLYILSNHVFIVTVVKGELPDFNVIDTSCSKNFNNLDEEVFILEKVEHVIEIEVFGILY
jgi:hypothetical protein